MDPIVTAAGTTLVQAMAVDTWQAARAAVVAWWRRGQPDDADGVERELERLRERVLAARRDGDAETEQALTGSWRLRLQEMLAADPELAAGLRRLLEEHLLPLLGDRESAEVRTIMMRATVIGPGQSYQAGRDQHFHPR